MTDLHTAARQALPLLERDCTSLLACHQDPATGAIPAEEVEVIAMFDEYVAAIAALRAALEAPQAEPVTAREVAQQVFALCEHIESLPESPADSFALERFSAGQRFAAKQIRRGIGTWLTDEENSRGAAPQPAHQPAQPQGWVLVPARLLQKAADVLEEATTYTHSESWSPSMTDELLALRQAMLAARPKETT